MEELTNGIASGGIAGGIAGYSYLVTIVNSHFQGVIEGIDYVGGIVGDIIGLAYRDNYNIDSVISNSYAVGNISGRNNTGGIAGNIFFVEIRNSYFDGKIRGLKDIGGIVGRQWVASVIKEFAQYINQKKKLLEARHRLKNGIFLSTLESLNKQLHYCRITKL